MTETLGDRIRARRAARTEQHVSAAQAHADNLRAYVDEQIAGIHARIDKLETPKKTPRK